VGGITTAGGISMGGALTVGGVTNITNGTSSSTTATGALVVSGGVGIAKNLYVGDGISAAGGITFSGITRVTNATSATSTTVAALTVEGGVGIKGALYVGGITTAGGISMGGALRVGGGLGVTGGGSTFDGSVLIRNSTASDDILSGALQVRGGVGIAGDLSVHAIRVTGNGETGRGISFGACSMNIPIGAAPMFAARAWAIALCTSTTSNTVSLVGSGNMSTVTMDVGKQFHFTFATQMPDANYAISAMGGAFGVSDGYVYNVSAQSATGFSLLIGGKGSFGDPPAPIRVYVVVFR
jgi:hypothetical protein